MSFRRGGLRRALTRSTASRRRPWIPRSFQMNVLISTVFLLSHLASRSLSWVPYRIHQATRSARRYPYLQDQPAHKPCVAGDAAERASADRLVRMDCDAITG